METGLGKKLTKPKSKKQWRLAIIQDVLDNLELYQFIHMRYLDMNLTLDEESYKRQDEQLQASMDVVLKGCSVCIKGALFLAKINFSNGCTYRELRHASSEVSRSDDVINASLTSYFSTKQLDLIEIAYEGGDVNEVETSTEEEIEAAANFCVPYLKHVRVKLILGNMIDNDGIFKP